MANLRFREKAVLENFLEMGSGVVLNFSNRTFSEFFEDFGIDIDDPVYSEGNSGSKANRMRSFWTREPDRMVADVLGELIAYANSYRPGHPAEGGCLDIVTRLRGAGAEETSAVLPSPSGKSAPQIRPGRPIEIFFSYAHEDELLMNSVRQQLVVHERMGQILKWHDRMVPAGDEWRTRIDDRIRHANVILLFMSPDFLESRYCYEVEGGIALERHANGTARVIPVVLRPCDWTASPFGDLQALPRDGVPITRWPDRDQATLDVARGIIESVLATPEALGGAPAAERLTP